MYPTGYKMLVRFFSIPLKVHSTMLNTLHVKRRKNIIRSKFCLAVLCDKWKNCFKRLEICKWKARANFCLFIFFVSNSLDGIPKIPTRTFINGASNTTRKCFIRTQKKTLFIFEWLVCVFFFFELLFYMFNCFLQDSFFFGKCSGLSNG